MLQNLLRNAGECGCGAVSPVTAAAESEAIARPAVEFWIQSRHGVDDQRHSRALRSQGEQRVDQCFRFRNKIIFFFGIL